MRKIFQMIAILAIAVASLLGLVTPAAAQDAQPPETVVAKDEKGREVTIVKGFDLAEYGGDDGNCARTELDAVELREEVGSPTESCKIVVEWSLKKADGTMVSGVFPLEPRQWFRLKGNVSGEVRYTGTMWYLPKGWNSHLYAADIAGDWQLKNPGLVNYVGLSPTDPWVEGQLANLGGVATPPAAATVAPTAALDATAVAPTPVPTPETPGGFNWSWCIPGALLLGIVALGAWLWRRRHPPAP